MAAAGDIVLIYYREKPSVYARIESIEFDIKPAWFQVTLMMLMIPSREVTWILKEDYINGKEFTMDNIPIRLEHIPFNDKYRKNITNKTKISNDTTSDRSAKIFAFRTPEQKG